MPDKSGNARADTDKFAYGFAMKHKDVVPDGFLAAHCYDETQVNFDPSKALIDCNPHKIGRKWRLVKKFEREMVCFDESRYLNDNFDEETLDIVKSLSDAEQQFMQYLAMMMMNDQMKGLSLETTNDQKKNPDFSLDQEDFHTKMAQVFDLAFAIAAEKRFLLFEDFNL